MRSLVALLVLPLLVAGCGSAQERSGTTRIAPSLSIALPPPRALGYSIEAHQLITAHFAGDTYVFETEIAVSREALDLVGLDTFGRRALTLRWSGQEIGVTKADWLPETIKPENILADMSMTYWPAGVVEASLAASGAHLITDSHGRSVVLDGKEMIRIDYDDPGAERWNGRVRYRNLAFGYDIEIRSSAADE